eukprot:1805221-Alexandrium_andersonii.AAC.1
MGPWSNPPWSAAAAGGARARCASRLSWAAPLPSAGPSAPMSWAMTRRMVSSWASVPPTSVW